MSEENNLWKYDKHWLRSRVLSFIFSWELKMYVHHKPIITLLLGSKAETILVKQLCYIKINGHFSI